MSTVGNTATPNDTFAFYGVNNSNLLAIQITMPENGRITDVTAYFAGHGGSCTARVCIWDNTGNLLAQSGDLTIGSGSGGISGQSFHTGTLSSPYDATAGQVLKIGFWRHANQQHEWTEENGGTEYQKTDSSNTSPPNVFSWNSTSGTPSIYATYTPKPAISSFTPAVGGPGTSVVIAGTNFTSASAVTFNGTSASFSVDSAIQITATVPAGATTGPIAVTTPGGTATSASNFTPSTFYVDDGSNFQACSVYADDGAAWQLASVYVDNGTSWVQIS